MIKLIASDLDGTIVGSNLFIPENNMKAIYDLEKKQIPLAICTGKTYALSKDICENLHAKYGIFSNGCQIIDLTNGREIARHTLNLDEIKACFSIAKDSNLHVHVYTENSIITPDPLYMDLRNSILFPNQMEIKTVDSVLDCIQKQNLPIFKLIISSPNDLSNIKDELENKTHLLVTRICKTGMYKDNIINKEYEYLDITPANVSKGTALLKLTNYLNLKKENILSIGDNLNDLDMFKFSYINASLNNACNEVKESSNYITLNSAENAGFAEAIYKFISFQ